MVWARSRISGLWVSLTQRAHRQPKPNPHPLHPWAEVADWIWWLRLRARPHNRWLFRHRRWPAVWTACRSISGTHWAPFPRDGAQASASSGTWSRMSSRSSGIHTIGIEYLVSFYHCYPYICMPCDTCFFAEQSILATATKAAHCNQEHQLPIHINFKFDLFCFKWDTSNWRWDRAVSRLLYDMHTEIPSITGVPPFHICRLFF